MIRRLSSQLRGASALLVSAATGATPGSSARPLNATAAAALVAALDVQDGALGVAQHHDAITSSQRTHVHRDYIAQLSAGQVRTGEHDRAGFV
jgi:hypothetical protein